MGVLTLRAIVLVACVLVVHVVSTPALRAEDSFGMTVLKAAGGSAAGKGAEFAVKAIGGLIYNAACKDKTLEKGDQYMCDILGSVSGKADEEWKAKIEKHLEEISSQLDTLTKGQKAIQYELGQQHKEMAANFDQVTSKIEAAHAIVRIENLWEKYEAQFDRVDSDVERDSMVAFAKDIINNNLHTKLGDLNAVLTKSVLDGQPLLRYPFYAWRLKKGTGAPREAFDAGQIYDFSEKKFMDYRVQQQKVFVMYLWAASVLESDCKLHSPCTKPPRSTADFKADFDRYTRQQLATFNGSVEWLLMSYGYPRESLSTIYPRDFETILLRANFLTANVMTPGEGLWGRVLSMGNKWDGSLQVTCGGATQTVKPVFDYTMSIDDKQGPMDWWVSRAGNLTYDEVRFANDWRIYHYQLPKAGVGPCTVANVLPNKGGMMPWVQKGTEVVQVATADGRKFPFGSFLAIQRAGGAYALSSGNWQKRGEPYHYEYGGGQIKDHRYEYVIDPGNWRSPWASLISQGKGEWTFSKGSRIHNYDQIYFYNDKKIWFPDDRSVTVNLFQSGFCANVCKGGASQDFVVMDYDIENDTSDKGKGRLEATAAIFLHPETTPMNLMSPELAERAKGNGVLVDGSYGFTGDHKTKTVSGNQSVAVQVKPTTGYHLQYLIEFHMFTEGKGVDATHWMYRAKLTPSWLYLTK